jgi:DNA-binding HxlR family transcriptional regulator
MQSTNNHKRPINVMDAACPSRLTLEILSDKWVMLVIIAIARGYRRNGELIRLIGGISQKMLTQTLRKLEQGGIVQRTVFNQVPPHVEYDLTPLGTSLLEPIDALRAWAETHYAEVTTMPDTF